LPFVAKTAPIQATVGETITISEPAMYGGKQIKSGEDVFLWSSEMQGGQGLWGRGTAIRVNRTPFGVEVRVDRFVTNGHFGNADIATQRDSTADTPIVGLARKLYRHAHNKFAGLTEAEAGVLSQFFQ